MKKITRIGKLHRTSTALTVNVADGLPRRMFDEYEKKTYNEALLMDGIVFRNGKKQLPLCDCGDTSSTKKVLGSVRALRIEHGRLVGTLYFASDPFSQSVRAKVQENHLNRFEILFDAIESLTIPDGKSHRGYQGPMVLVSKWTPRAVSIAP